MKPLWIFRPVSVFLFSAFFVNSIAQTSMEEKPTQVQKTSNSQQASNLQKTSKFLPLIESGTVLEYSFHSTQTGRTQHIPITLQFTDKDGLTMIFSLGEDFPTGPGLMNVHISQTSLDQATSSDWQQPVAHQDRRLPDEKVIGFSNNFVRLLKENNTAVFDGITYHLKQLSDQLEFIRNGKVWDTLYIVSEDGKSSYWLLNHPRYPILLCSRGNRFGPDVLLDALTNQGH